jgi:hypothetical protein
MLGNKLFGNNMRTATNKIISTLLIGLLASPCFADDNDNFVIPFENKADDDSEKIVKAIKHSMPFGLISVEQKSGRLLYNPVVKRLHERHEKEQFNIDAMIVNQHKGLKLVRAVPFACFTISSTELLDEGYKNFRQHETLRYIREVKAYSPAKVLICELPGMAKRNEWKEQIRFEESIAKFVFEDYISLTGEHFYYFVNDEGNFEMYM